MAQKKLTIKDLQREIVMLDRVTNALNTAVVALAYVMNVKGDELKDVTSDDYVKYITEHVHPLIKRADEIVEETAKKIIENEKKEENNEEK